jgi:hypothetical protein
VAADVERELLELLKQSDPPVRELARAARAMLHRELAPCHEFVYDMRQRVVLIYSASDRVIADGIVQLPLFRNHVTLVFPQGIELDDPMGILRGSGKVMRHVRIERVDDIEATAVLALVRQARSLAGMKRPKPGEARTIVTTIKRTSPSRKPAARRSAFPDKFF